MILIFRYWSDVGEYRAYPKMSEFAKGWWVVLRRRRDSAKGSLWTRHGNE